MWRFFSPSVVLTAIVLVPTRAAGQDASAPMRKLAADYVALCNKGDARGMAALYTEDAVWIDSSPDGVVRTATRPAIEKQLAAGFAGPMKGLKCTIAVTSVRAPRPEVLLGEGSYFFELPGQPPMKGLWINVAARQAGKWLIAHDMGAIGK